MTTLSISIASSNDDGNSGTGSGYLTSASNINLGRYFGSAQGWFRVTNVTIDGSAVISSNTLTGNKNDAANTAEITFRYVLESNPTYPTSNTDFNGRTLTTASVVDTDSGTGAFTSANLAAPAQEVIDQGGWASGNAQMLFALDGVGIGFEARIALVSYDSGSNFPTINWTYSSPVTAPLVVGIVTVSGVAPATKKQAPLVVGSVTFTGVPATVELPMRADLAVGSIAFSGVVPSTQHTAVLVVGAVAFSGVAPTTQRTVALSVGSVVFTGVSPSAQFAAALPVGTVTITGVPAITPTYAALPVGTVALRAGPRNARQQFHFNGATSGAVIAANDTPGWTYPNQLFFLQTQSTWENAFGHGSNSTVTPTGDGFIVEFNYPPLTGNRQVNLYTLALDSSGLVTVSMLDTGRAYPLTVRKEAPLPPGTVTFAGVAFTTGEVIVGPPLGGTVFICAQYIGLAGASGHMGGIVFVRPSIGGVC